MSYGILLSAAWVALSLAIASRQSRADTPLAPDRMAWVPESAVPQRDRNCPAPTLDTASFQHCLAEAYAQRIAAVNEQYPAKAIAANDKKTQLCQVILDRYRPLAHSNPGKSPLNTLLESPKAGFESSSVRIHFEHASKDFADWAVSQKPPVSIDPSLMSSVGTALEGNNAGLEKAPKVEFYSIGTGQEGAFDCYLGVSFVLKNGVAEEAAAPEAAAQHDQCGDFDYYAINGEPVAIQDDYDFSDDMSADMKVWTWNTDRYAPSCAILFTYKPLLTKSYRDWNPQCHGDECKDLVPASLHLAEAAERDSQALIKQALESLTASQRTEYLAAKDAVSARDHDEDPNDALYLPYVFNDRLYVVSLGGVEVKGRTLGVVAVRFRTVEGGQIIERGYFPVGRLKGDLESASVAPL
jgi:hypothetical protein